MKLTGKIALITNVSAFMGPAITEEFCREGASVALHDRDEAAIKPYALIAERLDRDVLPLTGDLSRSGEAEPAVEAGASRFGRLGLLSGTHGPPPALTGDPVRLARMVKTIPAGRLARSEESARLAVYLASEDADFFIGQVIPFAGGWVTP